MARKENRGPCRSNITEATDGASALTGGYWKRAPREKKELKKRTNEAWELKVGNAGPNLAVINTGPGLKKSGGKQSSKKKQSG